MAVLKAARKAWLDRPWTHAEACVHGNGHRREIDPSLYLVTLRKVSGYAFMLQVKTFIPCAAQVLDMAYWHTLSQVSPDAKTLIDWTVEPIYVSAIPAELPPVVFRGSRWIDPDRPLRLRDDAPKASAKPHTLTESLEAWPEALRYMLGYRGAQLLRAPDRVNRTFVREVLRRTLRTL